jgi:hypothetical protein
MGWIEATTNQAPLATERCKTNIELFVAAYQTVVVIPSYCCRARMLPQ